LKKTGPTIQDVARIARVSTATVSRALSNPGLVREATRKRVAEAVAATGYTMNEAARSLRLNRSGALLVMVPEIHNPFFSRIIGGMETVASEAGYGLLIANTGRDDASESRFYDYVRGNRADGLLLLDGAVPPDGGAGAHMPPLIVVCERVPGAVVPTVIVDNAAGAAAAVRHLAGLGHRDIGHVAGPDGNILTADRIEGYRRGLREAGLRDRPEWMFPGDFSLCAGVAAAERWLALARRPTALFTSNDEMAFGLISRLHGEGVGVPEDVSVIGFDDIEVSGLFVPGLTTIRQPREELGRRAVRLLLDIIAGDDVPPETVMLDTELVIRGSTAPPPPVAVQAPGEAAAAK